MAGFENDVLVCKNINFNPAAAKPHLGIINAAGKLPIGTGNSSPTPEILAGALTSPLGTLSIGYSSPNITLDIVGGAVAIEKIAVQTGTSPVVPASGIVTINGAVVAAGTNPIRTDGTGANTIAIEVQTSQALAAADATKIGLSNFNSTQFSVAATGFVSIINGGFTWTDVTGATQTLAVQNGYLTDRGAGVTYTLPATAAIGDEIRIVGKLGLATITPNANQQILMGSASGTVGVTGTAVATNVGDSIDLICTTSGASTVWRAANWVGNWTLS